jgi:hypothetical protein
MVDSSGKVVVVWLETLVVERKEREKEKWMEGD